MQHMAQPDISFGHRCSHFHCRQKNEKKSNLKRCLPFTVDLRGEHLAKRPHLPIALSNPPMFQWRSWSFSKTWLLQFIHLYLGPTSFWLEAATLMNQFGSNNDFDAPCTQVWNLGELTPSGLGLLNWGQGAGGRRIVGGTTIIVI